MTENRLGSERCDNCGEFWYLCSCELEEELDPLEDSNYPDDQFEDELDKDTPEPKEDDEEDDWCGTNY